MYQRRARLTWSVTSPRAPCRPQTAPGGSQGELPAEHPSCGHRRHGKVRRADVRHRSLVAQAPGLQGLPVLVLGLSSGEVSQQSLSEAPAVMLLFPPGRGQVWARGAPVKMAAYCPLLGKVAPFPGGNPRRRGHPLCPPSSQSLLTSDLITSEAPGPKRVLGSPCGVC